MILTPRQETHVKRIYGKLCGEVLDAGIILATGRLSSRSRAEYHPEQKSITLDMTRKPSPLPKTLQMLFSVAHEFGHHERHVEHVKVKRRFRYDNVPDMLYEEARAWIRAGYRLHRLGLQGKSIWAAYDASAATALMVNAFDYEAYHWLTERLERLKVRCPRCKSYRLAVLGSELDLNCTIQCRSCGTHTKSRRTCAGLSRLVRGKTITALCRCSGKEGKHERRER